MATGYRMGLNDSEIAEIILPFYQGNIHNDGESLREVLDLTSSQSGVNIALVEEIVCNLLNIDPAEIPLRYFPSEIDR